MDKGRAKAEFRDGNKQIQLDISIFSWEENSVNFVYCPALDLTGYGYSFEEAKESFHVILEEYIKYTHNKKTIFNELEKLGWAVNRRKRKVVAPDFEELLSDNDHFKDLYKNKNLVKDSSKVSLELA